MIRHAQHHGVDALIDQRHGRGAKERASKGGVKITATDGGEVKINDNGTTTIATATSKGYL